MKSGDIYNIAECPTIYNIASAVNKYAELWGEIYVEYSA